jgi:hypothetical protein
MPETSPAPSPHRTRLFCVGGRNQSVEILIIERVRGTHASSDRGALRRHEVEHEGLHGVHDDDHDEPDWRGSALVGAVIKRYTYLRRGR